MTPLEQWMAANEHSAFPPNIEGYWRPALELPLQARGKEAGEDFFYWKHNQCWKLPFPVVCTPSADYDKEAFLQVLFAALRDPATKSVAYRGFSMHRLLKNRANGSRELERGDWKWPIGYLHYIEMGVPPSRAFYKFLTGIDDPVLPTYGRS